mgnify:CR=1 FL=1
MKLDILVLAAHPDDAELSCSGIILNQIALGQKVGIVDFTKGELGTRGTPEIRMKEAEASSKILGLSVRENLSFRDGFFTNDEEHLIKIIKVIRKYKPEIMLINSPEDRHPDHGNGHDVAKRAIFLSGLRKIETGQNEWRPTVFYSYIQDKFLKPDLVVDVTPHWEKKIASILAFKSQFHSNNPGINDPQTYISSPSFLENIVTRAKELGRPLGFEYGEGLLKGSAVGTKDLSKVF